MKDIYASNCKTINKQLSYWKHVFWKQVNCSLFIKCYKLSITVFIFFNYSLVLFVVPLEPYFPCPCVLTFSVNQGWFHLLKTLHLLNFLDKIPIFFITENNFCKNPPKDLSGLLLYILFSLLSLFRNDTDL